MKLPPGWVHYDRQKHMWFTHDMGKPGRTACDIWMCIGSAVGPYPEDNDFVVVLHCGKYWLSRGGFDDYGNARWATEYPQFDTLEDAIALAQTLNRLNDV